MSPEEKLQDTLLWIFRETTYAFYLVASFLLFFSVGFYVYGFALYGATSFFESVLFFVVPYLIFQKKSLVLAIFFFFILFAAAVWGVSQTIDTPNEWITWLLQVVMCFLSARLVYLTKKLRNRDRMSS